MKIATLPKDIPNKYKPIIERTANHDTQRCLKSQQLAITLGLGEGAYSLEKRAYIPGELWPRHVPHAMASLAVVFSTLLDPDRSDDADMISEWGLSSLVHRPSLLRLCTWPGAHSPVTQVIPLAQSTAQEYRRLWEAADAEGQL